MKIDLKRYPYEMSGGQQQLVSIMRALVVEPEILFLDEPFSALDYEMTLFMREQLQRIFVETGTTTVLVSHDLEEAVYLADRILLLSRGPGADRRLSCVSTRRGRAPTRRCPQPDFVAHQGALPRDLPARGAQGMTTRFDPFLPVLGVVGLIVALVRRGLGASRRSGPAAVADRHLPRHVEGHDRRPARLRFPARPWSAPSAPR